MLVLSLLLIAGAIAGAAVAVVRERRASRRDRALQQLMGIFMPAVPAALDDPRRLLLWYPMAATARILFPGAFHALDAAAGGRFPFTRDQVAAAHATWTATWLAWEQSHDAARKLQAAVMEQDVSRASGPDAAIGKARLAAFERTALEEYQRRYEEYVTIGKALLALTPQS